MKKVLVITYHFLPEITPRAFRAFELASELSENYEVEVISPVASFLGSEKFRYIAVPRGIKQVTTYNTAKPSMAHSGKLKEILRYILHFFLPGGLSSLFAYSVLKNRSRLQKKYDAVISIGLPIAPHIAAFFLKRCFGITENLILDYGDPFSKNPKSKWSPLNHIVDKLALNSANHVAVPVPNAVPAFKGLVSEQKIHIIPQGLKISDIALKPYKKNEIPTCAYAGLFYERIRDPEAFFAKILSSNFDFRFLVYTNLDIPENKSLVEKYKNMDIYDRLEIHQSIPRDQCIQLLASCDFIVNFTNDSATQNPSKLIDYSLANRPILNVNSLNDDGTHFEEFIRGDYENAFPAIDLTEYDIRVVGKRFSELIENN
ncbi:hypothetical protein [Bdellovibrio bacteriovorus]|uniref:hypothetical protein n=1 Tax=Bdellovibrio bacteriovorus TaxID=959 RepID=UPI0035A6B952